jgi:FKBP-type peptidyl-prolyl cis-trans isomerase
MAGTPPPIRNNQKRTEHLTHHIPPAGAPRARRALLTAVALLSGAALLQACGQQTDEEPAAEAGEAEEVEAAATAEPDGAAETAEAATPPDPREANLAVSREFLEENAQRDGVTVLDNGLQYEVLAEGPDGGRAPTAENFVCVDYSGWLPDGSMFDSSQGRAPIAFSLGGVIPGWTQGLQLMEEGDTYRLFLPPELGYGERGAPGAIPPNAALVFEVQLHRVYDEADVPVLPNGMADPSWDCTGGAADGDADADADAGAAD